MVNNINDQFIISILEIIKKKYLQLILFSGFVTIATSIIFTTLVDLPIEYNTEIKIKTNETKPPILKWYNHKDTVAEFMDQEYQRNFCNTLDSLNLYLPNKRNLFVSMNTTFEDCLQNYLSKNNFDFVNSFTTENEQFPVNLSTDQIDLKIYDLNNSDENIKFYILLKDYLSSSESAKEFNKIAYEELNKEINVSFVNPRLNANSQAIPGKERIYSYFIDNDIELSSNNNLSNKEITMIFEILIFRFLEVIIKNKIDNQNRSIDNITVSIKEYYPKIVEEIISQVNFINSEKKLNLINHLNLAKKNNIKNNQFTNLPFPDVQDYNFYLLGYDYIQNYIDNLEIENDIYKQNFVYKYVTAVKESIDKDKFKSFLKTFFNLDIEKDLDLDFMEIKVWEKNNVNFFPAYLILSFILSIIVGIIFYLFKKITNS